MRHKLLLALIAAFFVLTHAAVDGYSLFPYRWKSAQVPFYVNPQNGDVAADVVEADLRAAADVWSSQSQANFTFYYMGRTTDSSITMNQRNTIFFREGYGDGIAVTYSWANGSDYLEFDIVFYDGNRLFGGSSGCSAPGWYITDIAVHEFGHGLGLGHSTAGDATMYGGIRDCSTDFRTLSADDIAGIEKAYPAAGTATPSSPSNMVANVNASSPTSSVQVSWADTASDEAGFSIERSANGGSYVEVARVGSNVTTFTNSGLASGTSYTYRARAYNSAGYSGYSNAASATTQSTSSPTPSPSSFTLSSRGYKVKGMQKAELRWSGTSASSLVVYRNGAKVLTVANTGAYTDSLNRKGGGTYLYQVCEAGTTACSNTSQVTF